MNEACRTSLSAVQVANSTSATSFGSTRVAPRRAAAGMAGKVGIFATSLSSFRRRSPPIRRLNPVPTRPA
jgi:hypothetical protein